MIKHIPSFQFFLAAAFLAVVLFPFTASSVCKKRLSETGMEMAVRMAESEMKHFPDILGVDYNNRPAWNYTQGLIAQSMLGVYQFHRNKVFYDYARSYADQMIDEQGNIKGYKPEEYNIDRLNSGKFLFDLYHETRDERYKKAIFHLREQLKTHPRTSEGGFWHKKIYTHQMWLDGLYMGAPFYARFARDFNEPAAFNDIIDQFSIVHRHTYDTPAGLNYHGWDESREQKWANPGTGCSPHFWGRAMGWYTMALVDVLDFIPPNHPRRGEILSILTQVSAGIKKHQDKKSGLWYQVMDLGSHEGNYLEATASSMFTYALLKAVRKGYLPVKYKKTGISGYQGIVKHLIKENSDGTISLTRCCAVAGLGGNPYRDGSYEYYIGEPVRDNDPKGVGPFILASLEINLLK
jgi:unsaturated rhamnogalacturonyl hydrolase